MNRSLIYLALVVRIAIAILTRTFFQPDEYFQALEPAHALVFGYGHITWEWLAARPIRSILYPSLNVPIYWMLNALRLDRHPKLGDVLMIAGPRILHGSFAALTDIWTALLATRIVGETYTTTAYFLSLTSTFNALSLSRSLSNSLETSLTTIAFAYFPWDSSSHLSEVLLFNREVLRKSLTFAALACAIRPTNAVIWIFLFGNILWQLRFRQVMLRAFLSDILVIGILTLGVLFMIDSLYYHQPTLTPMNFALTNLSSVSVFYGGNSWHFYVSSAIPILCTTTLPFVILGLRSALTGNRRDSGPLQLASYTVAWTLAVYSLAKHKEWRFIHPLLPLLHIVAAKWLVDHSGKPVIKKNSVKKGHSSYSNLLPPLRKLHVLVILASVPGSLFLVFDYGSAPISVMSYIRSLPSKELSQSVGFLMPCHSTPGHAYLHREELKDGRLWALGCEPPLRGEDLSVYMDQTDVFYQSPAKYLKSYFPSKVDAAFPTSPYPASRPGDSTSADQSWMHEWPKHLVFFGQLLSYDGIEPMLKELGYKEVWRRGRDWEGDGKRKGGVRVWKWACR